MRRILLVMLAIVMSAVLVGVVSAAVGAQGLTPVPILLPEFCDNVEHVDLNRDGRLDHNDFELWVWTLHEGTGEECRLGGPASACPAFMDVNRDGKITHDDLWPLEEFLRFCVRAPWQVIDPGG